jgi:arsenate reductase
MSDQTASDGPISLKPTSEQPSVLFVCVHNAGRSQMAAGFLSQLSGGAVEVRSAGSVPGDRVNPSAAMAEVGIDISRQTPKVLTILEVQASDVVITMGCGDACPIFPGKRYLDWDLEDPAGKGVAAVRPIRDEIKALVQALLFELLPDQSSARATAG